jgi:hypothetical protein
MDVTVTNTTSPSEAVTLGDIYKTLEKAGDSITFSRTASDLSRMASLQQAAAAGKISVSVVPTADELASGLLSAPQAIQAQDMQPVASSAVDAPEITLRIPLTAGGGGAADDVTVYALNALPYKFRVLWARMIVSGAVGGSTAALRTQAAGAGTLLATMNTAAAGLVPSPNTGFAETVVAPATTAGLFVRRSDSAIAGVLHVCIRRES